MNKSGGMTREQKWAVVLLSFGTFLEYFDLMLYIHMATLLNEIFFPKTDIVSMQLLAAFTFCSTFLLRPVGGFIIGRIGDFMGRKATITLTTTMMSCCCIAMAITPIYAEIGITASVIIIVCRVVQGFASLGEIVATELYIIETLKSPYRYVFNGIIRINARFGALLALSIALLAISIGLNWRIAFWIGAIVAVVGLVARIKLRETPEFTDYKRRIAKKLKKNKQNNFKAIVPLSTIQEKANKKTIVAYFFIRMTLPTLFYITAIHLGGFMKESLGMTAQQVISQNLKMTATLIILMLLPIYLMKKYHPIKIIMVNLLLFIVFLPFIPYMLNHVSSSMQLLTLQIAIFFIALSSFGIETMCFKYFPISQRFTITATTFGIAETSAYLIISFSLIPLTSYFGHYGLLFICIPVTAGFFYAVNYFRKLEIERGLYFNYPCDPKPVYEDTASDKSAYNYALNPDYDAFKGECERSKQFLDKMRDLNKEATVKVNIKLVEKAIIFAKRWHGTQVRKTGEPFYHHPIAVADIISNYYFKTDVLVACILHDTVEDDETKQCTVELIEKEFNKRIAQLVEGVTKNKVVDGEDKILALKETLDDLSEKKEYEALLIKITDRTHNMQTADGWSPEKRRKKAIETTRDMLPLVAPVAEKLNIEEGIELEEKLFKPTNKALNKDE